MISPTRYAISWRSLCPETGWRRHGFAFLAGAVGALAMAPVDWPWAMLVTVAAAFLLVESAKTPQAALLSGWWLGFGYLLAGLWWLGQAFFVDPDFIWAAPLGVIGLPAALALFYATGFGVAKMLWRPGVIRLLILTVALSASEALRGTLFTGFPWNSLGMALGSDLVLAQVASLVGLNGLTVLTLAIGAGAALLMFGATSRERIIGGALAFVLASGVFGFGVWRLSTPPSPSQPGVHLRVMQPNMPLDDHFSRAHATDILRHYFELSTQGSYPDAAGVKDITHLIWPETAFPFLIDDEPKARAAIADAFGRHVTVLSGAARGETDPASGQRRYFNAIEVIDPQGHIAGHADKVHLVPFGEYLPFSDLLSAIGLRQFVTAPGGYSAARERRALSAPGLPLIAPLICYEAIFPNEALPDWGLRPSVFLNVTNDAWFGITPGPWQHFAQARLRAIEQGLPLIRAANSGVSAIVDGYGRTIAMLPVGATGVIDGDLPLPLEPPIFAQSGAWPWANLIFMALIVALILTKRQLTSTTDYPNSTTADR